MSLDLKNHEKSKRLKILEIKETYFNKFSIILVGYGEDKKCSYENIGKASLLLGKKILKEKLNNILIFLNIENNFYVEKEVMSGIYLKGGVISVNVTSNESIGTGSSYGDDTIFGTTVAAGYKYDMDQMFIKAEVAYSDYETIKLSATNTTNTAEGDIDAIIGKIAIGYKF